MLWCRDEFTRVGREQVSRAADKEEETEKGQATNAGSDLEVIEVTGQERGEQEAGGQAMIRVAEEANPTVGEEAKGEVPFVRKRRRLTKLGEMVPVREGTSGVEVVPTEEEASPEEDGRGTIEGSRVRGETRTGEEGEGSRAELPLIIVPAEQPSQREQPA